MTELQEMYNLSHVNALDYYRIKLLTKAFVSKNKPDIKYNLEMRPFIPTHLKIFFKQQKGASLFNKTINKSSYEQKMKTKWCQEINQEIDVLDWKKNLRFVLDSHVMPHSLGSNTGFCSELLVSGNI